MVDYVRRKRPRIIADFAAGDGNLLTAAQERWPDATIIATDLSARKVRSLCHRFPHWQVDTCDFLRAASKSSLLSTMINKIDVILLNPPFSCRGGRRYVVSVSEEPVHCSIALAFVLSSVPLLADGGQLIAILPAGCLTSQKDQIARELLHKLGVVRVIGSNGRNTFSGCFPHTVIAQFVKKEGSFVRKPTTISAAARSEYGTKVHLVRGRVPMHSLNGKRPTLALPLVHSTQLRSAGIDLSAHVADAKFRRVSGPAVLMHRVGLPNVKKVVLYKRAQPVVLSDCVIALRCTTLHNSRRLLKKIKDNWSLFEQTYGGTCAPYTTVEGLVSVLTRLGFKVTVETSKRSGKKGNSRGSRSRI